LNYKLPKEEKDTLKCPKCGEEINDKLVRIHVARTMGKKGGKASGSKPRTEAQKNASIRNLEHWRERQEEK